MKRIIVMVLKNIIFVPYYWIMLNWYAAHVDKNIFSIPYQITI